MANTFKNEKSESIGTTETTVYTVPASTTSVTIGCNVANRTTATINVDVKLGTTFIVKGAPIPANSALSVLDGKIILEAAETIKVTSDTASSADVILSVLEQS